MATLSGFPGVHDAKILQRGRTYYQTGAVTRIVELSPGEWEALVEGSETYWVFLGLSGSTVTTSTCNCPYDQGPVCKHQIAAYLAIAADLEREAYGKETGVPQRLQREQAFHHLVEEVAGKVSAAELARFIALQAQANADLRHAFRTFFRDYLPGKPADNFQKIIRGTLRQAEEGKGFLDQRDCENLSETLMDFMDEADDADPDIRPELLRTLISEVEEAMKSAEDWEGYLSMVRDQSRDLLNEAPDG